MSLSWIDKYVKGIFDYCHTENVYEICRTLGIGVIKIDKNSLILRGSDAIYIRDYFNSEIIFIRDDLNFKYERFAIAHELGHAVLHTEVAKVTYSNRLPNNGKKERQANYFAYRLLGIKVDGSLYHRGLSFEQIIQSLYVADSGLEYSVNF